MRKVQKTGGSTLIVSLPRKWVKDVGLEANDYIGIMGNPDGSLNIIPHGKKDEEIAVKKFTIDEDEKPEEFFRNLVGAYVVGYELIESSSEAHVPITIRKVLREFTSMTIGMEIVEETQSKIIIKDLLDPRTMPFTKTIKRMSIVSKDMVLSAATAIKDMDRALAEDIIYRDVDIDRLAWLIHRQYNILLKDISLGEKLEALPAEAINHLMLSRSLERISDHAVKIAQGVLELEEEELDEKEREKIATILEDTSELFERAITTFLIKDIKAAHSMIEEANDFINTINDVHSKIMKTERKDPAYEVVLANIMESIRRIEQYTKDIAETSINYIILKKSED